MDALICILLVANGHLIRDGFPALGSTQLARVLAGFWCLSGLSIFLPWWAGAALLLGFYTDQKHAEGQQACGWRDAGWLAVSGVTSLMPLAMACAWFLSNPWLLLLALGGLAKPPLWFTCWYIKPDRWCKQAYPTRVAAALFGAVIGAIVAAVSS